MPKSYVFSSYFVCLRLQQSIEIFLPDEEELRIKFNVLYLQTKFHPDMSKASSQSKLFILFLSILLLKNTINKFVLGNYLYTVIAGQTDLLRILIKHLNRFIYRTFINSHTKLEKFWVIKMK